MKPKHFLMRMFLFLFATFSLVIFILPVLIKAFLANIFINSLILLCLFFGIGFIFLQVYLLGPEVQWLEACRDDMPLPESTPKLLSPLVNVLKESTGTYSISTLAMRSLLDSVDTRLDDSREISRFLPGLLVFLGLLGTFWGLVQTVGSIADVISNLNFTGQGGIEDGSTKFFDDLKNGLKAPLAGMGLAFSASMFGLAGSLILSFLDLQAGQAYRHFSRDLEEWLSTLTRLPIASMESDKTQMGGSGYLLALMEQTNETMNHLFRMLKSSEDSRGSLSKTLAGFAEKVGKLTDQMKTEQNLMVKIAESQIELQTTIKTFSQSLTHLGIDDSTKTNLRNLDAIATKILEEMSTGRKQVIEEVRDEIRLLSRTIANLAGSE
jgi:hypothetical protein